MRVLVTGGTGLLGSAIRQEVAPDDTFVFVGSKDADLTCWDQTRALFQKERPTHVLHLAARVGGLFANQNNNRQFFVENMSINVNVLEACRQFGVVKVVSCLSTCVFPDGAPLPLDPAHVHAGPPHPSNQGYSYAKRMLEVMSRLYAAETGNPYVCVIPTNMYGPRDNFNLENAHVLPALVHRAHLAAARGEPLRIRGTGQPLRQFLYAPDAARMVLDVLFDTADAAADAAADVVLSNPLEVSVAHVGNLVAKEYGIDAVLDGDPAADGQRSKTSRSADRFRDFAYTPLESGLQKTVEWFRNAYSAGGDVRLHAFTLN